MVHFNFIQINKEEKVARILLNRASAKNALSLAMWGELKEVLENLAEMPSLRVLVIGSSVAGVFSAGADIKELATYARDRKAAEQNRQAIRETQGLIMNFPTPTIAVIDGACRGAGLGIATHCDLRIASMRSTFAVPPARLGLVYPFRDTKRLTSLVGVQFARRMILTAETVNAQSAHNAGLVDFVFADDCFATEAKNHVAHMASLSPSSLRYMKSVFLKVERGQTDDHAEDIQKFLDMHEGPEAAEGFKAFFNKTKPQF